jgi:hypothetical protein
VKTATTTTSEPTRRDYERKCGIGAQVLALLAEQEVGGDKRSDTWTEGFGTYAEQGVRLPDTDPKSKREALEQAAVVAGAVYMLSMPLQYEEGLKSSPAFARAETLAANLEQTAQELTLEIGRLLLQQTKAEASGALRDFRQGLELVR